jgi:hypothetical protein
MVESFPIDFLGETIACETLEDAVAVTTASDILFRDDPTPYKQERLDEIADTLSRYGREKAAGVIRTWLARIKVDD